MVPVQEGIEKETNIMEALSAGLEIVLTEPFVARYIPVLTWESLWAEYTTSEVVPSKPFAGFPSFTEKICNLQFFPSVRRLRVFPS